MRALLVALASAVILAGCGASDTDQVQTTLNQFAQAVATRNAKPICDRVLAPQLVARLEGVGLSCEYAIDHLSREVHLRFEPRADGGHLNVALASMASKYLREVCMLQFNRYWLAKRPGLKPTAGYPTDAGRFFADIQPVLKTDGTDERTVWRAK